MHAVNSVINGLPAPLGWLPTDLQDHIVAQVKTFRDLYRLFRSCQEIYQHWQARFLEKEGPRFIRALISAHNGDFGKAACFLETHALSLRTQSAVFQRLFTELMHRREHCIPSSISPNALCIVSKGIHEPMKEPLIHLDMRDIAIDDNALVAIAPHTKKVETLYLSRCTKITDQGLISLIESCKDTLRSLHLTATPISDASLRAIATRCTKLADLNIASCKAITAKGLEAIAKGRKDSLAEICLGDGEILSEDLEILTTHCSALKGLCFADLRGFTTITLRKILQDIKTLSVLHFGHISQSWPTRLPNSTFEIIAQYGKNLVELCLSQCPELTDNALLMIAQGCPNLERLFIEGSWISEVGLAHLATHCSSLSKLALSWCPEINNTSLLPILRNCKNLRVLDLRGAFINDLALLIIGALGAALADLSFANCDSITDVGVKCIAEKCIHLERIAIGGRSVSGSSLASIAEHSTQLTELILMGCAFITDADLLPILDRCTHLKRIGINECPAISENIRSATVERGIAMRLVRES